MIVSCSLSCAVSRSTWCGLASSTPLTFRSGWYISQFCSLVFFYILFFLLSFLILCSLEFWDCCYLLLSLSFPLILFALIFVYYYINFILKKTKLLHFKTYARISVYSVKDGLGWNTTVWLFLLWFWRCTLALPLGPGGWDGVCRGGSEEVRMISLCTQSPLRPLLCTPLPLWVP